MLSGLLRKTAMKAPRCLRQLRQPCLGQQRSIKTWVIEEFFRSFHKNMVLVKGGMMIRRPTRLPILKQLWPLYSYSNMAGHGAFMFMALSYLETGKRVIKLTLGSCRVLIRPVIRCHDVACVRSIWNNNEHNIPVL